MMPDDPNVELAAHTAVEPPHGTAEPPKEHKRRMSDQPKSLKDRLADMVIRNGPFAVLAAVLLYFLLNAYQVQNTSLEAMTKETQKELRNHSTTSAWLMRQICINSSVQAGTSPVLCEPPVMHFPDPVP